MSHIAHRLSPPLATRLHLRRLLWPLVALVVAGVAAVLILTLDSSDQSATGSATPAHYTARPNEGLGNVPASSAGHTARPYVEGFGIAR